MNKDTLMGYAVEGKWVHIVYGSSEPGRSAKISCGTAKNKVAAKRDCEKAVRALRSSGGAVQLAYVIPPEGSDENPIKIV